jgi:hypothetical protein
MGDEIGEDGIRKARSAFNTGLNKVRKNVCPYFLGSLFW